MSAETLVESPARRPQIKLWPLGSLPLSMGIIWALSTGGEALRWLVLGGFGSVMVFCLMISLEAGLIAMMIFEPLRGFLRRAQYLYLTYSQSDPIHVVTPVVTLLAFANRSATASPASVLSITAGERWFHSWPRFTFCKSSIRFRAEYQSECPARCS